MTSNPNWPLPTPDSLGGLLGADDVRDAMKATIDLWQPYYLDVLSHRLAAANKIGGTSQPPNPLQPFGTWVDEPDYRNFGTGEPAAYLVTVPTTVGIPDLQGSGKVRATWRTQVSLQVFGTDWQETADLTSWYEKCIRWCVLQHRSLGGFATMTKWVGGSYAGKEHTSTRTEGIAVAAFDVTVDDVIEVNRGPKTVPPPGPPGPDPTVLTTVLEMTKYPVDEPLPQES